MLREARRWPGVTRAREAVDLMDPLAESPLESRSRVALRRAGLPIPEAQTEIRNHCGTLLGRVDFYWEEWGVAGEADGASKYSDPEVLFREKRRQEALEETGLVVVRWGSADLQSIDLLERRIREAFRRGANRGAGDRSYMTTRTTAHTTQPRPTLPTHRR